MGERTGKGVYLHTMQQVGEGSSSRSGGPNGTCAVAHCIDSEWLGAAIAGEGLPAPHDRNYMNMNKEITQE